jgi:hypothetical protein
MVNNFSQKSGLRYLVFLFVGLFLTLYSPSILAQEKLVYEGKFIINKGNADGAKILIYKNGTFIGNCPIERGGRFELELDFDADYIISFEKPNYVTKKLSINSRIPAAIPKDNMEIFGLAVELNPQEDKTAIKVYDNPVGKIMFDLTTKRFDSDKDYSASFQRNGGGKANSSGRKEKSGGSSKTSSCRKTGSNGCPGRNEETGRYC